MTTTVTTRWFRFLGMNIKGSPAMTAVEVAQDLAVAQDRCSVLVTQEFKWPWYWRTLRTAVALTSPSFWRTSPGLVPGFAMPVRGAQSIMWKGRRWKRTGTKLALLHKGIAGISEDRFIRAVLLQDRKTRLRCWFLSTHFVVGGDRVSDSARRRSVMAGDLAAFGAFVDELVATGHPIIGQLDANLRPGSEVYRPFLKIVRRHKGEFHGAHGVEFLFTIDGRTTSIEVKDDWIVPTYEVNTDHEGRGITARIVAKAIA
jgi:hypothetical protein